jgi:hypothetical protein
MGRLIVKATYIPTRRPIVVLIASAGSLIPIAIFKGWTSADLGSRCGRSSLVVDRRPVFVNSRFIRWTDASCCLYATEGATRCGLIMQFQWAVTSLRMSVMILLERWPSVLQLPSLSRESPTVWANVTGQIKKTSPVTNVIRLLGLTLPRNDSCKTYSWWTTWHLNRTRLWRRAVIGSVIRNVKLWCKWHCMSL